MAAYPGPRRTLLACHAPTRDSATLAPMMLVSDLFQLPRKSLGAELQHTSSVATSATANLDANFLPKHFLPDQARCRRDGTNRSTAALGSADMRVAELTARTWVEMTSQVPGRCGFWDETGFSGTFFVSCHGFSSMAFCLMPIPMFDGPCHQHRLSAVVLQKDRDHHELVEGLQYQTCWPTVKRG